MGATNFANIKECCDYKQGFEDLAFSARIEYGDSAYNGTLSTCQLCGRPTKLADRYTKSVDKKAWKWLEDHDYGRKWECRVLDLGIVGYEISKYVKVPHTKATAQFQTRFVAMADHTQIGIYNTAAEARTALEGAMGQGRYIGTESFFVEKRPVNVTKGSTTAVEYRMETRITKSKPKNTPKGALLRPIHRYCYYGWAGC